jgi:hypothetical protein
MTAQVHETLIYEGEEASMTTCPPLPASHPRLVPAAPPYATEAEGVPAFVFSTACWRRYVGTWEVKGGRLYLNGVAGLFTLSEGEPLFADWVSGRLVVPRGELLSYVHMGFESVYERELHLRVEAGVVVETRELDNRREPDGPGPEPRSWLKRLLRLGRG